MPVVCRCFKPSVKLIPYKFIFKEKANLYFVTFVRRNCNLVTVLIECWWSVQGRKEVSNGYI